MSSGGHGHMDTLATHSFGESTRVRIEIAEGGLLQQDLLSSYFGADWAAEFDAALPGVGALFGRGLEELVGSVLAAEQSADWPASGWPFVHFASGGAPLPAALASRARAVVPPTARLDGESGATIDHHALLGFTQVAVANSWTDQSEGIEAALMTLDPDKLAEAGDERTGLLEIAIWRALIEPDLLERTRVLGRHLARLGRYPVLREQAEQAALHFARGLSGQHSEAFVDALAEIWAGH